MLYRRLLRHLRAQNWFAVGIEFAIVVVGVFIGLQASNWNDARAERRLGEAYLAGLREDLLADADMLDDEIAARQQQRANAQTVLEFYEGRELSAEVFFEAFYAALYARETQPNRNTMDEMLNAGGLHLISDAQVRSGLLELQAAYHAIASSEEHLARDFDEYLYDPTFTAIPIQIEGPWVETPALRRDAQVLLNDTRIENGMRLLIANLSLAGGIEEQLATAQHRVHDLLERIPAE